MSDDDAGSSQCVRPIGQISASSRDAERNVCKPRLKLETALQVRSVLRARLDSVRAQLPEGRGYIVAIEIYVAQIVATALPVAGELQYQGENRQADEFNDLAVELEQAVCV